MEEVNGKRKGRWRLKKEASVITILLFAFLSCTRPCVAGADSLSFQLMLDAKMLHDAGISGTLNPSFDLSPDHLVLLASGDQYYLLGWGGIVPYGTKTSGHIAAFAYTPDSLLMTIRGKELCMFDTAGHLSRLFGLPNTGMRIAAGRKVMYLYDNNKDLDKNAVYVISPGGKYARLVEVPDPINGMAETKEGIIFATGNKLLYYFVRTKELKVIAMVPAGRQLLSVAYDALSDRVYYSEDKALYVLSDSAVTILSPTIGGRLLFYAGGLMVFDPQQQFLLRIEGLSRKLEKENNAGGKK